MKESDTVDHKSDGTLPASDVNTEIVTTRRLQWFREGIAGIISLVILVVTALMLYGAFSYARDAPATTDAAVLEMRKNAHERQKDIMLYALALLGTVTGYYLGRAPAELHAQQAQKSANTANQQLHQTQSKLTETASGAATAAAHVAVAEREKETVKAKLKKATDCLNNAGEAISKSMVEQREKTLGESAGKSGPDSVSLKSVKQEIENTLREINSL